MQTIKKFENDVLAFDSASNTYVRKHPTCDFIHARLQLNNVITQEMILAIADHIRSQKKENKKEGK